MFSLKLALNWSRKSPGNPLFCDVRNEFYRDAHGILLVFDATNRLSFESLARWLAEIHTEMQIRKESNLKPPVILVCANKTDLKQSDSKANDDNIVDEYEAKLWADVHGFSFCEASAQNGTGVGDMFHTFFSQIVKQQNELDRAGSLPR